MITGKHSAVLDLMGRRPSARRPLTVGLALFLAASLLTVGVLLLQHRVHVRERFLQVFNNSLFLESEYLNIPRQVEFVRFSKQVEQDLQLLAKDLLHPLNEQESSKLHPRTPFSRVLANDSVLSVLANDNELPDITRRLISDSRDSAVVLMASQYFISEPFAPAYLTNGNRSLRDLSLDSLVRQMAVSLAGEYERFAALEYFGNNATIFNPADEASSSRSSEPVIAHLYAALRLPRDIGDSSQMRVATATRIEGLKKLEALSHPTPSGRVPRVNALGHWRGRPYDTLPFILIGLPASRLNRDYDCTGRPWFRETMDSCKASWTASYPDAGTGLPVITAAVPITVPGDSTPLGVVAVDFLSHRLSQIPSRGITYLLNFGICWIATLLLMAIVIASSRLRFDPLLWAFACLLFFYFIKVLVWSLFPEISATHTARYIDAPLSFLTSTAIASAALLTFAHFKHHPFREDKLDKRNRLDAIFLKIREQYQVSLAAASALLMGVFSLLVEVSSNFFDKELWDLILWVDASTSAAALIVFAYFFCNWTSRYFRSWITTGAYAIFIVYAAAQLFRPSWEHRPEFWTLLAMLKGVAFLVVVFCVYWWTQLNNYDRVRRAGSRATILSRLAQDTDSVILAGIVDTGEVLFADRSFLRLAGYGEDLDAPMARDALSQHPRDCSQVRWDRSEFGVDLFVPKDGSLLVPELFETGEFDQIANELHRRAPDQKFCRVLADRSHRVTFVKFARDGDMTLKNQKPVTRPADQTGVGETSSPADQKITIVSLTAWHDVDSSDRSGTQEFYRSPWYFVLFAKVTQRPHVANA